MIRVLLADDAAVALRNMERLVGAQSDMELVGTASDGEDAVERARSNGADVVVVDRDLPGLDGLQVAARVIADNPGCGVVVMGLDDDDDTIAQVSAAGAREYLVKPFSGHELVRAIRALRVSDPSAVAAWPDPTEATDGRGGAPSVLDMVPHTDAAPAPRRAADDELDDAALLEHAGPTGFGSNGTPEVRPGGAQVFTVVAGKGGVGKSVLAVNAALLIARETGKRLILVDLDLQGGDVGTLLRLEPATTIVDLAKAGRLGDGAAVSRALVASDHGVRVLLSHIQTGPALSAEQARQLFTTLRGLCDIIVVDTPTYITPAVAEAVRGADEIVVVSGMSDPGVRATRRELAAINAMGARASQAIVVLNRNEANSDFTRETVEETLGREVALQLPYDLLVIGTSVNRGTPFVVANPDSPASRRVRQLVGMLVPSIAVEGEQDTASGPRTDTRATAGAKKGRRGLFGFARS